jgi:hypothetical protein
MSFQGTLPFLSVRILRDWCSSSIAKQPQARQTGTTHTAIDDLESFLWVLFSSVLEIIKVRGNLTKDEAYWASVMGSQNLEVQAGRSHLMDEVQNLCAASPVIRAFSPILLAWGIVAQRGQRNVKRSLATGATHDELFEDAKTMYAEYIKEGSKHLDALSMTWDDLFPSA